MPLLVKTNFVLADSLIVGLQTLPENILSSYCYHRGADIRLFWVEMDFFNEVTIRT